MCVLCTGHYWQLGSVEILWTVLIKWIYLGVVLEIKPEQRLWCSPVWNFKLNTWRASGMAYLTFFFSFMEWNGCISHLFFTVGFILSLLYYFPAPVICYTSQWEFNLNPTAQYCFYKGYLNKKLFRITHILHTIWSVILFIFASPREVVPKAIKSASNVGELWLEHSLHFWPSYQQIGFYHTTTQLEYAVTFYLKHLNAL